MANRLHNGAFRLSVQGAEVVFGLLFVSSVFNFVLALSKLLYPSDLKAEAVLGWLC